MTISECSLALTLDLAKQLPEFSPPFLSLPEAIEKLRGRQTLFLVTEIDGAYAGFKAGYQKENTFYSWLGGVFPAYRRRGVAKALANYQENWARQQGYQTITFKTMNRHRNMLLFGIKNNFQIIDFQSKPNIPDHQILLQKDL